MEYLTFALPLALLLTWLGWQMWDERSRKRRETELRLLEELNERKLRDQRLIELQIRSSGLKDLTPGKSMTGLPQGVGQNISEPKPEQSLGARAGGFRERLATPDSASDYSCLGPQDTAMDSTGKGGGSGQDTRNRVTAIPFTTPGSPTSSSSAADGSHGVASQDDAS